MTDISPGPWSGSGEDTIEIDGKEWPGFATVTVNRGNKWDDKKSKGEHTGERDFTGADAAKCTISIRVWTRPQRDLIDGGLISSIEPEPGKKKVGPVSVKHSVFNSRKVSAVTIDDVQGWERTSVDEAVLTIRCQEYRVAKTSNATGKAKGTNGQGPPGTNGTYTDKSVHCTQLYLSYQAEVAQALSASNFATRLVHEEKAKYFAGQMDSINCTNVPPSAKSGDFP